MVSPFQAGDHKAPINRRTQRHNKYRTEKNIKRSTKEVQCFTAGLKPVHGANLALHIKANIVELGQKITQSKHQPPTNALRGKTQKKNKYNKDLSKRIKITERKLM